MLFITKKLRKRRALALLIALAAAALVLTLRACAPKEDGGIPAETNEERLAYLASLGWEVAPEPIETLHVTLGKTLTEPYLSYNDLQRAQGFDLARWCGKTLTRYTYAAANHPAGGEDCQIDLYVCEGVVAAGDVIRTSEGGGVSGLAFPAA